jgi:glycosyltransferase involved in cell wall biosynthesis
MNAADLHRSPDLSAGAPVKPGTVYFATSPTQQPCGIEMFQRELARTAERLGTASRCVEFDGAMQALSALWPALNNARALVVSLPVVAWKRAVIAPVIALALARLRGVRTVVILHEWADLNPLRRAMMSLYLAFAQSIFISSPSIERGFSKSLIARLATKRRPIPIPPNLTRPSVVQRGALAERLMHDKRDGRLVLGQFGSIYPKKRADFVLDVAAALRKNGRDARVVFIGSFIKGHDDVEARFWQRVKALGLAGFVTVTGYVSTAAEIFALFEAVDVFVYAFREGLTSRRGSVLTSIQSGRPVVVNQPCCPGEFDHHPTFRQAMQSGLIRLVPTDAGAQAYADTIAAMDLDRRDPIPDIFRQAWCHAARALGNALSFEHGKRRSALRESAAADA